MRILRTEGLLAFAVSMILVSPAVAGDSTKDPGQIGNRDVGKGINFYSIQKEIALGRQMAQARHGTRQASGTDLMQYGTLPVIFIGGMAGFAIYKSLGVAVPRGFLTFSRGFESEADMLGLHYVCRTGYDPTAFVDFFEKIESQEKNKPGLMSKLFATHPQSGIGCSGIQMGGLTPMAMRRLRRPIGTIARL